MENVLEPGSMPKPDGDGRWIYMLGPGSAWFTARVEGPMVWTNLIAPNERGRCCEVERWIAWKWRRPTEQEWLVGESDSTGRICAVELHAGYSITRELGKRPLPKYGEWEWLHESSREGKPENRLPEPVFRRIANGHSSWILRTPESAMAVADAAAWDAIWRGEFKPLGYI